MDFTLPSLPLPRGSRHRVALVAGLLAILTVVGSLAIRPLIIAILRDRLSRFGSLTSLAVHGSTLDLLQGKPTSLTVHFSNATVGKGTGTGTGAASKLAKVDHVGFAAKKLHTKTVALDNVNVTINKGALHAHGVIPSQSLSLIGQQIQITPKAVNGDLELTLGQSISLIVTVADGQLRLTAGGNGTLAGQQIPASMLPGGELSGGGLLSDLHITSLTAHDQANRVELGINGHLDT